MTRETIGTVDISYNYDSVGNRLSRTSTVPGVSSTTETYDNNDRINSDSYDENGSTTTSNGKTYSYDFEQRLISVTGGGVDISLTYDGDGNRISKSVTTGGVTTTTKYLVDENNPTGYAQVAEEIQNKKVVRQYTYGNDLISENQLIAGSWKASFYGYDGHGSVRFLTDSAGSKTDSYDYDAFGILINKTGTTPNVYLYAGEQWDQDLGLYYNRARYLNTNTGRFWTKDSFEGNTFDPPSLHKYLYANADPINKFDPSGQMTLVELQVRISAVLATVNGIALRATNFLNSVGQRVTESFEEGGFAVGNLFRSLGAQAESFALETIQQFPRVQVIGTNVPIANRFIDVAIRVGNRLALIEVKYSLNFTPDKFERIVSQLRAATNSPGYDRVVLWSLRVGTDPQVQKLTSELEAVGIKGQVTIVQGINGLAAWLELFSQKFF